MSLLEVKDLKTYFRTSDGIAKAVDGVSFSLEPGEALGIVGESGCGKTTSALSICRLLPQNGYIAGGSVTVDGVDYTSLTDEQMLEHRWKDVSIIFQGAMNAMNPVKTVGFQIAEAIMLHENATRAAAFERAGDLLELVEIPRQRANRYPHEFSGGMKQRAMIAMALACHPKIVIGDEPTTALDVMVQAEIIDLLGRLRREMGMGLILITHDLSILADCCDRIAVMYAGRILETGTVGEIFENPAHPYTQKLIACFPNVQGEKVVPDGIPGYPPRLIDPPDGCRFCPRCTLAGERCRSGEPPAIRLSDTHSAVCWEVKA